MKNFRLTIKRISMALLLCLCAALLSGCSVIGHLQAETELPAGAYYVYYANRDGTGLTARQVEVTSEDFDGIFEEVLEAFRSNPEEESLRSALPDGVTFDKPEVVVHEADVDFSNTYLGLTNIQQILLRAALAQTLFQFPEIYNVRFTADGQALTDSYGREIGIVNASSFIISRDGEINSVSAADLVLYFSSASGDRLVQEVVRDVTYSSNSTLEEQVVKAIIRGPAQEGSYAVADAAATVHSVQTVRELCVVDFDKSINTVPASNPNVTPETALYAFVDAICRVGNVSQVRFEIDGSSDERFRGQISLNQVFTADESIIEEEDTDAPETAPETADEEDGDGGAAAVSAAANAVLNAAGGAEGAAEEADTDGALDDAAEAGDGAEEAHKAAGRDAAGEEAESDDVIDGPEAGMDEADEEASRTEPKNGADEEAEASSEEESESEDETESESEIGAEGAPVMDMPIGIDPSLMGGSNG